MQCPVASKKHSRHIDMNVYYGSSYVGNCTSCEKLYFSSNSKFTYSLKFVKIQECGGTAVWQVCRTVYFVF